MSDTKYKAFVVIPLVMGAVHVAFKLDRFRSPVLAEGPVDILDLIKAEQPTLEELRIELDQHIGDLEKIAQLQSQVKLPEFISTYVESGQKTNAIFDILPKEEFEEATIEESKVDLKTQNELLAGKIKEFEADKEEPKDVKPAKTKK